ncbi:DUF1579 domain-containing protein [Blastomonas sp.]|uniref:DUF1579 domain-containing protein n=1 Tax=Blastomonas sp. TaxID=1909299 RepID=UPI003594213E
MNFRFSQSVLATAIAMGLVSGAPVQAQNAVPVAEALIAEQRAAMARVGWMDGVWRGTVSSSGPEGDIELVQTERIGALAGGTVRLIEGRGYHADGGLAFNAVAMVTYDPAADEYVMTSTARGMTARPWFKATAEGFNWGIETGAVSISYFARHQDGVWTEEGFMAFAGQPKRRFLTMRLERVSDTDWPGVGTVGPK